MQPHLATPPRIDERAFLTTLFFAVHHILRSAKTICTNARRRTIASDRSSYCRLERLTSASSEAGVSTNSCKRAIGYPTPPDLL